MEKLVFATIGTPRTMQNVLLMVESLRAFGGELAESPFYVFTPTTVGGLLNEDEKKLEGLNATLMPFDMAEDGLKFPLAWVPYTAEAAEMRLKGKTELLVWLLADTLVIQPPTAFYLREGINLGYRPVHHTLLGSLYDLPLDEFWALIYEHCGVPEKRVFPMETCVRDHTIRPYFNAGMLVVRPELGLLTTWGSEFERIYQLPEYEPLYNMDERYMIFIHQAVLSGVILKMFKQEEIVELPEFINYPVHLHASEIPIEIRPKTLNDLIICRHEGVDALREGLKGIEVKEPLKGWMAERLGV